VLHKWLLQSQSCWLIILRVVAYLVLLFTLRSFEELMGKWFETCFADRGKNKRLKRNAEPVSVTDRVRAFTETEAEPDYRYL
jgi:hypothetical protein